MSSLFSILKNISGIQLRRYRWPAAIAALTIFISPLVHAEYRVFLLLIENTKTSEARTLESTLDPDQYRSYFPLSANEQISYTSTWRCPGRAPHFGQHCSPP